jgi:fumarate hydratase class II
MPDAPPRVEHDSLGALEVPAGALWGAQTERARRNFRLSARRMPRAFLRALGLIKWAAATVHGESGALPAPLAAAIAAAALEVAEGGHDDQFPVDVFQTGSGTSSNMNANEVIAHLAGQRLGRPVHANDEVNRGQSSNDVVPTAIHVAAALELEARLVPALRALAQRIGVRAGELAGIVKTGRTHLMDAVPLTLGQELGAWRTQIEEGLARLAATRPRLLLLAQGGTAIGTGLNAPPGFGSAVAVRLAARTGLPFVAHPNPFVAIACQDTAVELSGQLRVIAVSLGKIANDLRLMSSGPLAGLGEIALPVLQPGSSIMPGKVNPVIPEAVLMVVAQVIGNDACIAQAGQAGNFQLNTMLPLIADNLLDSIELLANAARALAEQAIAGFSVNETRLAAALAANPILVTALNERIGYEKGAAIAKRAYAEGRALHEVALEDSGLSAAELDRLLDPRRLTGTGGEEGR